MNTANTNKSLFIHVCLDLISFLLSLSTDNHVPIEVSAIIYHYFILAFLSFSLDQTRGMASRESSFAQLMDSMN